MSKCDVPAILEEVSEILRVISDVVKNPADLRRPIPSGWVDLGPAKLQPRKPGDKHWSIAAGGWVDTPDDAIEYANLNDWRAIRKVDEGADESSVAKLVEGLAKAMQNDPDLAWAWHCKIAVGSLDEGVCHETASLAAARFMRTAFGVDMTTFDQWKSVFSWALVKEISSKFLDHIADANKMVNCPVIPDSSASDLLVDTTIKFKDGSGTVPSLSGWTVEPDAYISCLCVFPVPHGWMMICPEAKTEPRVVGDMFYRITKGHWEELTEANVEQANKQNWTAIRKIPSVVLESEELLGSKPQYRDPTAADIGKTIEVRSEYYTFWEERELVSICNEEIDNRFVCRHKNDPKRLKLWSNARVKVQTHIL